MLIMYNSFIQHY